MGHILLNWGSYDHLHLKQVLSNLTTYLYLTLLMFLTTNSELIPSLWLSWLLMGLSGSYIYVITSPSPIISRKKSRRHPPPNWKRSNIWHHRKLHYWLVRHCRRQPRHRTPCLDGYFFPSPHCTKHRLYRRGRARARALFKRRRMNECLSGRKDGYCP